MITSGLYQEIKSSLEIEKYIQQSIKTLAPIYLWTSDNKKPIRVSFFNKGTKTDILHVFVPNQINLNEFENRMDCYFNVSLAHANLYFKSPCIKVTEEGLEFKLPKKTLKLQRRKNFRLPIPDDMDLIIQFQDPTSPTVFIHRNMIDLSEKGMSFLIHPTEKEKFYQNLKLKKIHFLLNKHPIHCSGTVMHIKSLATAERFSGVKIGIKFDPINNADQNKIAFFISEMTKNYFAELL